MSTAPPSSSAPLAGALNDATLAIEKLRHFHAPCPTSIELSTKLREALRAMQPELVKLPRPTGVPAEDVPGRLVSCLLTELEKLDMTEDPMAYAYQLAFVRGFFAKIERYVLN